MTATRRLLAAALAASALSFAAQAGRSTGSLMVTVQVVASSRIEFADAAARSRSVPVSGGTLVVAPVALGMVGHRLAGPASLEVRSLPAGAELRYQSGSGHAWRVAGQGTALTTQGSLAVPVSRGATEGELALLVPAGSQGGQADVVLTIQADGLRSR